MIIGIAGKAGSGKDLVGNIIQYLIACKKYEGMDCFNADYVNKGFNLKADYTNLTEWKIKKFADRLKDIVCLLIGCTRQQLEDQEFKEKELGEEWYRYGLIRKNSAKPILFPSELENIECQLKLFKGSTLYMDKLTPRKLLQLLGTECGRNIIHPNIWVNATMVDYNPISGTMDVRRSKETFPNWIITDMRFPNELEAIKNRNGITIRINRGLVERTGKLIQEPEHISETALNNAKFDYVIENDGTIEELLNKVKKILINEKII
jgi:hypothetical protein